MFAVRLVVAVLVRRMAATGLSCGRDTVGDLENPGRHSSQRFLKGKGNTASEVEFSIDSNQTTRLLDAIALGPVAPRRCPRLYHRGLKACLIACQRAWTFSWRIAVRGTDPSVGPLALEELIGTGRVPGARAQGWYDCGPMALSPLKRPGRIAHRNQPR